MGPLIGVMPLYDEDRDSIWLLPGYQDLIGTKWRDSPHTTVDD